MTSSLVPLVDARSAAFTRLASRILETLNDAVEKRTRSGATRTQIAAKVGCHRSQLTRVLNGSVKNLTLRTISDILWATDFEARDFEAEPVETINPNCSTLAYMEEEYVQLFRPASQTYNVNLSSDIDWIANARPSIEKLAMEHAPA